MDRMVRGDTDLSVDLESGRTTIEEERWWDAVADVRHTKKLFGRVWSVDLSSDGLVKDEDDVSSCDSLSNSAEVSLENVELLADKMLRGEENVGFLEQNAGGEMPKKKISKKHPKPPRPPQLPILDAVDQKIVREISELAMLKRARNERMKVLKKMKATKSSSSISNLCAMAITILFLLVILLQAL